MLNNQKEIIDIGKRIRQLRLKKGYTSHETFAYEFELSRVQYWRIESGKTNITISSLISILNIHKINLEDFFKLKIESQ